MKVEKEENHDKNKIKLNTGEENIKTKTEKLNRCLSGSVVTRA
jgi:hypothetical protein